MNTYLTVQDVVWIHTGLCGAPHPFDYERLENAVAAQYGYGDSSDIQRQALRMAQRLAVQQPFVDGHPMLPLVSCLALLALNGLYLPDDAESLQRIKSLPPGDPALLGLLQQGPPAPHQALPQTTAQICRALDLPLEAAVPAH